ncbi:hypothetical protein ACLB2K_066476 [Fragaria x ananassa]
MEDNDPWLARDKLYHFLFCFSLTLLFSTFAARTPYRFLRCHSIRVGSLLSLLAGAAKEFADELGFFHSAGASAKDALANFLGVVVASLLLSLARNLARSDNETGRIKELSMTSNFSFFRFSYVILLLKLYDHSTWLDEGVEQSSSEAPCQRLFTFFLWQLDCCVGSRPTECPKNWCSELFAAMAGPSVLTGFIEAPVVSLKGRGRFCETYSSSVGGNSSDHKHEVEADDELQSESLTITS